MHQCIQRNTPRARPVPDPTWEVCLWKRQEVLPKKPHHRALRRQGPKTTALERGSPAATQRQRWPRAGGHLSGHASEIRPTPALIQAASLQKPRSACLSTTVARAWRPGPGGPAVGTETMERGSQGKMNRAARGWGSPESGVYLTSVRKDLTVACVQRACGCVSTWTSARLVSQHHPHKQSFQERVHEEKSGRTERGRGLGQVWLFSHPMISAGPARRLHRFLPGTPCLFRDPGQNLGSQLLCVPGLCPRQPHHAPPSTKPTAAGSAGSQAAGALPALKLTPSQSDFSLPKDLRNMNGRNEKLYT